METLKLRTHIGSDGLLKLEMPTGLANREIELLVVMQTIEDKPVDALGWPIGFFDRTYGALADDPIERPIDFPPDIRDEIE